MELSKYPSVINEVVLYLFLTERENGFLLPTSITTLDSFIITMPKSDTWPGGVAIETMTGMDSAGSCDSVVSMNSGFVSTFGHPHISQVVFLNPQNKFC